MYVYFFFVTIYLIKLNVLKGSLDTLDAQMADMNATDIFNFILIGATIGMILAMLIIVHMCKAVGVLLNFN